MRLQATTQGVRVVEWLLHGRVVGILCCFAPLSLSRFKSRGGGSGYDGVAPGGGEGCHIPCKQNTEHTHFVFSFFLLFHGRDNRPTSPAVGVDDRGLTYLPAYLPRLTGKRGGGYPRDDHEAGRAAGKCHGLGWAGLGWDAMRCHRGQNDGWITKRDIFLGF